MQLIEAISTLDPIVAKDCAKQYAESLGISWEDSICFVFEALLNNRNLIPKIRGRTPTEAVEKWVLTYNKAKNNRLSVRRSNLPGTIPDPLIRFIIQNRLSAIDESTLKKIDDAHALCMAAENILGLLLEEYLANKLIHFGWHFAWGSTVSHVDFCHTNGSLLQIKNRSNSENSSSRMVRNETSIQLWFRGQATTGAYRWEELNQLIGSNCSESEFQEFVRATILANPYALAVDPNNFWAQ